ncbi:UDP-N-acetylmuramoyl-L-alanyl-D-glutamate--2,6-diaminopimelate ligase [candidate division GN15 bacterium]|uniref:UDP-N-acetylmuramoyl-L-alanyl-D-glutamate--2,6-diaminopimelate ligase n=1 Tax=candidate division GN15 bacterium TaxID=2072418 RepID=A0A855X659_9BACT|nr:MAG: UDP-N-acetylmuramoyl-L-alanyl-D-glutamate--2,6-diaminopimelate ligase [candidate division GN15 bacterium]
MIPPVWSSANNRYEESVKLSELIHDLEGAILIGDGSLEIENLEYDSRQIRARSLFFAIKGYTIDGYDFVGEAVARGAVAVLGERDSAPEAKAHIQVPNARQAMSEIAARFYGYPGLRLKVCGVTGTNGKTTTCNLIKRILEARGKKVGLVTSLLYDTGQEKFKAERTTPESLDMQRLLFLMRANHCVNAVVEVSSHALMLNRVDNINFRVAVYTNLTRDHLDFHGTMEAYFKAKAKLLDKLDGPMSYAVINLDVPEFHQLFGNMSGQFLAYSLQNRQADIYCGDYDIKPDRTIFDLVTPMGTRTISLKLPGRFNLMNALAAAAGGLASGCDIDTVVLGLEAAEPIPGRFNYVDQGQSFAVYVDFAHTPDAIERLCESARPLVKGRLLLLFGCGGDRDKGKRPLMGKMATTKADFVMVTSDNPRSEEPQAIIDDIKPGLTGDQYEIRLDRREAIAAIMAMAQPGDAVLLAGKGAEDYQEIKGVRHPFDDASEARAALKKLGFAAVAQEEH